MEIHRRLGNGFLEVIYKDALEIEFQLLGVPFSREERFNVYYKSRKLPHHFTADFTAFGAIIIEIKSTTELHPAMFAQTINYLKVSQYQVGLLINFGQASLEHRRFIL